MARKTNQRNTAPYLSGLYAVSRDVALSAGGKPRPGVYGMVTRDTPFITKPKAKPGSKPKYLRDMTDGSVPTALKDRILAFWDDPNNDRKEHCYLVEKPLYDEMTAAQRATGTGRQMTQGVARGGKRKGSIGGSW